MTKLFKALGATLLAVGLVVAGVATPASAADMTSGATATATGSIASTGTNAYPITVSATTVSAALGTGPTQNTTFNVLLPTGWTFVTTGFTQTCAGVNVTVSISPSFTVFGCEKANGASAYLGITQNSGPSGIPANTTVQVTFPAGSINVNSNRIFTFRNGAGILATPLDSGTATLASAPTQYTVVFNGNGSTGGGMSVQSASSSTALTSNNFSKTGSTFAGWNTAAYGSGTAYADGANYAFSSSTTLYAQWTAGSSGNASSGSNSSSSDSLANTGIDGSNGIMFLLEGLSLSILGTGMIMIARRKRSN